MRNCALGAANVWRAAIRSEMAPCICRTVMIAVWTATNAQLPEDALPEPGSVCRPVSPIFLREMRVKNFWRVNDLRNTIQRRICRGKIFIIAFLFVFPLFCMSQVPERFPKPDFQTDYTRPDLLTPTPRAKVLEYIDIFVLVAALSLASYFAHKQRSRRNIFLLMVFSLVYFGFYRKGCVCSIGKSVPISNHEKTFIFFLLFNPVRQSPQVVSQM